MEPTEIHWPQNATIEEIFYIGQTKMSQGKYDEALKPFQHISNAKKLKDDKELLYWEKSLFEESRCNLKLKKYKTAVSSFQRFIKSCPKSSLLNDAWFYIGEIYEKANNQKTAIFCFKKAALIPNPKGKGTIQRSKRKLKNLGIEI